MIPTNTIRALPLIASMLGNKLGVKVDIGNRENACTDGNTIYFPSLPWILMKSCIILSVASLTMNPLISGLPIFKFWTMQI